MARGISPVRRAGTQKNTQHTLKGKEERGKPAQTHCTNGQHTAEGEMALNAAAAASAAAAVAAFVAFAAFVCARKCNKR